MKKTLILLLAIILIFPLTIYAEERTKKEIKVSDNYDLSEFFSAKELNKVYSTKPSVADIKNYKCTEKTKIKRVG